MKLTIKVHRDFLPMQRNCWKILNKFKTLHTNFTTVHDTVTRPLTKHTLFGRKSKEIYILLESGKHAPQTSQWDSALNVRDKNNEHANNNVITKKRRCRV